MLVEQQLFQRPEYGQEELYRKWRKAEAEREQHWIPENVRFVHDPGWRETWLSIQSASDRTSWVWIVTAELFMAAHVSWLLAGFLMSLRP